MADPTPNEPSPQPTFESKLEELNGLIASLEGGRLGLEEAIATFERGKKLHQDLLGRLAEFERRIDVLTRNPDGSDRIEPAAHLDPGLDSEDED